MSARPCGASPNAAHDAVVDQAGCERAEALIPAGSPSTPAMMQRLGAPLWITCDRGIRWGLAFERAR
jgi:hypothetical protein